METLKNLAKKYWKVALVALILILGVCSTPWFSPAFRYCVNHDGQYPTANHSNDQTPAVRVPKGAPVQFNTSCIGSFVNENSAAITAVATILLAVVTAGLVWIVFRQLTTTRAQLRAYIFVGEIAILDGPTPPSAIVTAPAGCPTAQISIRNYGQTPAYRVRHRSAITICKIGAEDTGCKSSPITESESETAIGPNGFTYSKAQMDRTITDFEKKGLETGAQLIVAYGSVVYEDAFRVGHETHYRFGYGGAYPIPRNTVLLVMKNGNTAT